MTKPIQLDVMLRARVSLEQKRELQAISFANQCSISDVVRTAIREFLALHCQDRPEPEPGPPPPPRDIQPETARA
jgi:hypothetical protein